MANLPFTAVDVVVAVVLLGSALFAFMRGFVHEVLAITAWVGAVFAVLHGLPTARPYFRDYIGPGWAADAAAGLTLFLVTLLLLSMLTKAVADRVRRSALNSVDSSLGFLFGLARGAVLLCLAYMLGDWLLHTRHPAEPPTWLAEARTRPWLERGSALLRNLAPEGFGTAEAAAKEASAAAKPLVEAERTFQKYVSPLPTAPAEPRDPKGSGYDRESRSQMERLIQTKQ